MKRHLTCPSCSAQVKIPWLWILGVEIVFCCPQCRQRFKTGYKAGAVLFALGLTGAVATVNLGAWLFSSLSIPVMALAVIPLWLFYGFLLRRWWLLRRVRHGRTARRERMSRRAEIRQKQEQQSHSQQ